MTESTTKTRSRPLSTIDWKAEFWAESDRAMARLRQMAAVELRLKVIQQEAELRRLLERWVSELEPSVVMDRNHNILGLCDAATDIEHYPYIFNPFKGS